MDTRPAEDVTIEDLFAAAVAASRLVTDPDDPNGYDDVIALSDRAAATGPGSVAFALARLDDPDPVIRATACDLAGSAGAVHTGHRAEIAAAMSARAAKETDADVEWSIAVALGRNGDGAGAPTLIGLAGHRDSDVRYQVACALPFVHEGAERPGAVVDTLITLTADADEDVRDWATFGLGWIVPDDGDAIRAALWIRTTDPHPHTREEGIRGLARRRDPRALPLVAELLAAPEVSIATFDAAEALADPSLLPLLAAFNPADVGVADAIAACEQGAPDPPSGGTATP